MKIAVITGITGQDGSYLAEFLLSKGYEIHGMVRRASTFNRGRVDHLSPDVDNQTNNPFYLHYADLTDTASMLDLIHTVQPEEIYHLAAQSHVRISFDLPEYTADVTALGTVRLLETLRKSGIKARFYQASSSEMFGSAGAPQNESTPFEPQSPYAIAKVFSYWTIRNYRKGYGIFASNGILFNHESPRRGENFVTRKITRAIAGILSGKQNSIHLGNLDARRDWGYAPEYVEAMWLILQQERPDDFVIGTGESHTVREFLELAFGYANLDWQKYIIIDPHYFRPNEVDYLMADPSKANKLLGWKPKLSFRDIVHIMVDADLELAGLPSPGEGKKALEGFSTGWHKWASQTPTMDN